MRRRLTVAGAAALAALAPSAAQGGGVDGVAPFRVVGDAIPEPLAGRRGNVAEGRRVVRDREIGNCLICHHVPIPEERFQGDLGPSLAGVGDRLSAGQIRLRLIDQSRLNPRTVMPPYHRADGLNVVAERYQGQPVLSAQEIEDVVAYLASLRG